MKYIAAKDTIILFKKLLVILALYLIPVLFVWASLTLVKNSGELNLLPQSQLSNCR